MIDATLQGIPVPYLPWLRMGACQAQRKHSQTARRRPCIKVFHIIFLLNALFSQAGVHKYLELCVLRSPDCKVPLKDVVLHIAPRLVREGYKR